MTTIRELCKAKTTLSEHDILRIEEVSKHLQSFADISQADYFIDCPTSDLAAALVVAWAAPKGGKSLYQRSVVGQLALRENEPAVLTCLQTGNAVRGCRGISQERIPIQQNVVPIKNAHGMTIGTLIMEQDITEQVEQEKSVELLTETTEHLSVSLMEIAMSEARVSALMQEGIILFDYAHKITHVNARAYELLGQIEYETPLKGVLIDRFLYGKFSRERFQQNNGMILEEIQNGRTTLLLKAVLIYRQQMTVGGVILLRDISALKEKDKQLMIKSQAIKEIHHRVKNNLQTIASLLRLQMRRSKLPDIEQVYRESINRINSIAVIHEILAQNGFEYVDMKEVIAKISKTVVLSMARQGQAIEVALIGKPFFFASDKAMSLALIITELIQNCMLHAFKEEAVGLIAIEVEQMHNQLILKVTDDGKGIGYAGGAPPTGHLGLKIVDTLIKENLGGALTFTDTGKGTEVTVTIPM